MCAPTQKIQIRIYLNLYHLDQILIGKKTLFLDYQALRGDDVTCVEYSIPSSLKFLPSPKCLTVQFYVKKESRLN